MLSGWPVIPLFGKRFNEFTGQQDKETHFSRRLPGDIHAVIEIIISMAI
jgi:hypothetical protein